MLYDKPTRLQILAAPLHKAADLMRKCWAIAYTTLMPSFPRLRLH